MESAVIDDDRALLGLDLPALADGQRPGLGELDAEALYLVCTHGSLDASCGIRGRPLAEALARIRPGRVWECSHLGGHRFAPNVVCLPAGLVYGRVPPEGAAALVRAHERGEVTLGGRSFHPPAVQAAEHFLRQALGVMGIDVVEVIGVSDDGAEPWTFACAPPPGAGESRSLRRPPGGPGPSAAGVTRRRTRTHSS